MLKRKNRSALDLDRMSFTKLSCLCLAFVWLGAIGCTDETRAAEPSASAEEATSASAVPKVKTTKVTVPPQAPPLLVSGKVVQANRAEISFSVSGRLRDVNLVVGRAVTPDLPAARLHPGPFRDAVDDALNVRSRALGQLSESEGELRRAQLLFENGSILIDELHARETALAEAQETYDLKNEFYEAAQAALEKTELTGEHYGVVDTVHFNEGMEVEAGAPIYTIALDTDVRIHLSIDERSLVRLRELEHADISFPQLGDKTQAARIRGFEENEAQEIVLVVEPSEEWEALREGMDVLGELHTPQVRQDPALPFAAIQEDAAGWFVWIVEEGHLKRRQVLPGERSENGLFILSGIQPGDEVVTGSLDHLDAGIRVHSSP